MREKIIDELLSPNIFTNNKAYLTTINNDKNKKVIKNLSCYEPEMYALLPQFANDFIIAFDVNTQQTGINKLNINCIFSKIIEKQQQQTTINTVQFCFCKILYKKL